MKRSSRQSFPRCRRERDRLLTPPTMVDRGSPGVEDPASGKYGLIAPDLPFLRDQELRGEAKRRVTRPKATSVAPIPSNSPVWEPVAGSSASTLSLMAVGPAGGGAVVGVLVATVVAVVSVGPAGVVSGGFVCTAVDAVVGAAVVVPVVGGAVVGDAVVGDAVVGTVSGGGVVAGAVVVVGSDGTVVVTSGSQSTDTLNPPLDKP